MNRLYDSVRNGIRKYALPVALTGLMGLEGIAYSGENVQAEKAAPELSERDKRLAERNFRQAKEMTNVIGGESLMILFGIGLAYGSYVIYSLLSDKGKETQERKNDWML